MCFQLTLFYSSAQANKIVERACVSLPQVTLPFLRGKQSWMLNDYFISSPFLEGTSVSQREGLMKGECHTWSSAPFRTITLLNSVICITSLAYLREILMITPSIWALSTDYRDMGLMTHALTTKHGSLICSIVTDAMNRPYLNCESSHPCHCI